MAAALSLSLISAAVSPTTVRAQDRAVFGDGQLFAPADLSNYGNGPARARGWFGRMEYVDWAIGHPHVTTIGRPGFNPVTFDGAGFGIQVNSLDTGFITQRLNSGSRLELGYIGEGGAGWLVSHFIVHKESQHLTGANAGIAFFSPFVNGVSALESFVDATGAPVPPGGPDGIDDDLNGNHIFGRHGEDLGTPNTTPPPAFIPPFDGIPDVPHATDFGDLAFLPVFFDTVNVRSTTSAWGIEINRLWQLSSFRGIGQWEMLAGARYLRFRDGFMVEAFGKVLDRGTAQERILGVLADSQWNTTADNNLVGPEIGVRWKTRRGRLSFIAQGRFFAASNFQQVRQAGFLANPPIDENGSSPTANPSPVPIQPTPTSPTLLGRPINLFPTAFHNSFRSTQFSPAAEFRMDFSYQVFRSVAVDAGFTYFFADNIARSSNMIDYTLPAMGILASQNRANNLTIYGVNFGFSFNR